MQIDDISVKGRVGPLPTNEDVDAVEAALGLRFPNGYREYVTRFGAGVLGGTFVRIYLPSRILTEYREFQERWDKYWFWEDSEELLPKSTAVASIIIGDTLDGDELVFQPANPARIFVLPRNHETAFEAGTDLMEALDWCCSSGVLTEAFPSRLATRTVACP